MAKYVNTDKIPYTRIRYEDGFDVEFSPKLVFKDDIDKMPSADVVEVVRCKDCKYHEKSSFGNHRDYCDKRSTWERTEYVNPTDFCSKGKRRETE